MLGVDGLDDPVDVLAADHGESKKPGMERSARRMPSRASTDAAERLRWAAMESASVARSCRCRGLRPASAAQSSKKALIRASSKRSGSGARVPVTSRVDWVTDNSLAIAAISAGAIPAGPSSQRSPCVRGDVPATVAESVDELTERDLGGLTDHGELPAVEDEVRVGNEAEHQRDRIVGSDRLERVGRLWRRSGGLADGVVECWKPRKEVVDQLLFIRVEFDVGFDSSEVCGKHAFQGGVDGVERMVRRAVFSHRLASPPPVVVVGPACTGWPTR